MGGLHPPGGTEKSETKLEIGQLLQLLLQEYVQTKCENIN